MNKNLLLIFSFIFACFLGILLLIKPNLTGSSVSTKQSQPVKTETNNDPLTPDYTHKLLIKNQLLLVEIADSSEEIAQGLSGRNDLAQNHGMLFIFPKAQQVTFWMPDMSFPLDMVFIRDKQIVHIEKNVPNFPADTPLDELPRYSPPEPVDWVLELQAGWSEKNDLQIGDLVELME